MKSYALNLYNLFTSDESNFKIIDTINCKKYIKTYSKIPEGFIHSGHMLFYKVEKKIKIKEIAKKSVVYTHFYKISKLRTAIKDYNGIIGNTLDKGRVLYIPHSLPFLLPDLKKRIKPEVKYVRGLYFTGASIGSDGIWHRLNKYRDIGINAVVFDAKDVTGIVNYFSSIPDVQKYNTHERRTIDNIDRLIRILKSMNIYIIARIAVFRDHLICRRNPDYTIKSKSAGGVWNVNSKERWCDPSNRFVQDYNIRLAIELAEKGVDEIQFDYIRFPTVGNLKDMKHKYHFGKMSNEDTITLFLKRAYSEISRRNTLLSIDIFGIVAWGKKIDIRRTGQKVELLSKYCDIISPMLYPSHFGDDFEGIDKPGDSPYYFIFNGCKKSLALSGGKVIRPWLQAFKWRTTFYDESYILKQILACKDAGASGYMFWNSGNKYETVYRALSGAVFREGNNRLSKFMESEMSTESLISRFNSFKKKSEKKNELQKENIHDKGEPN